MKQKKKTWPNRVSEAFVVPVSFRVAGIFLPTTTAVRKAPFLCTRALEQQKKKKDWFVSVPSCVCVYR